MRGSHMSAPRRTFSFARLAAALLCALAFALTAVAQSNKATITGTISDPNGAVVKDAKVTVTNIATNEAREATTSDDGTYTIPAIDPGVYRVTVDASGFSPWFIEEVKLDTGSRQAVDVALTVGAVGGEAVTVTAEAPPAAPASSVRGALLNGRQG